MSADSPLADHPLDDRKEHILRAIVEAYVRRGEPVGSKNVADGTELGVSSATIRNEMAILEREGYISHPHTSAGRIPTDKGYRYYVDVLAPKVSAAPKHRAQIETDLRGAFSALDELLERTSQLLTELTDYTSLAASPSTRGTRIHRIEVVRIGTHRLLLVCIGEDGWHDDRVIDLDVEVSDSMLSEALRVAHPVISGATTLDAANAIGDLAVTVETAPLLRGMSEALRAIHNATARLYTGGTAKLVVWEPVDTAQRVLELLEGRGVEPLLAQPAPNAITVRIGHELALEEVRDLSLIATGYQLGKRAGALGIIGPTRMDYPTVIATVAEVASTLSRVLRQLEA